MLFTLRSPQNMQSKSIEASHQNTAEQVNVMLFLVVLFCTVSIHLAVLTTADHDHESRKFLVQGTKIEGKDAHCYSSCPVSLKLNQVLLVTTDEPVSIAAWLIVIIVVLYYTALNLNFAFIITAPERVFIQSARVERQQPWDERAAADRTDNLAVNGNRTLPQEHDG